MRQIQQSDKAVSYNQQAVNQKSNNDPFQSNFHLPQKYQQQRAKITLKPPTRDNRQSLQISSQSSQANLMEKLNREKHQKFNKSANNSQINIRKSNNSENRTNSMSSSNSKSRLSANLSAFQMAGFPSHGDSEHKNTQSAIKLKQIIGNSDIHSNQIVHQQSGESPIYRNRQNLFSNISNNQQSTSQESFTYLRKLEKSNANYFVKTEKSLERVVDLQQKLNQLQSQYCQKIYSQNTDGLIPTTGLISNQGNDNEQQIKDFQVQVEALQTQIERVKQIQELSSEYQGKQSLQEKTKLQDGISNIINKLQNKDKQTSIFQKLLLLVVNNVTAFSETIEISAYQALKEQLDQKNIIIKNLENSNYEIEKLKQALYNDLQVYKKLSKQSEQERNTLQGTINDLQNQLNMKSNIISDKKVNGQNLNVDGLDTNQLKDISNTMQNRLQEMSEKEQKLIKLVLAIKKTGVDIEKIYNEEVLNDDSEANETVQSQIITLQNTDLKTQGFNDADNSIVNDSDESSFHYNGRNDQDSVMERNRFYQKKNQSIPEHGHKNSNPIKLKLNLSHINKKIRQKPANIFKNVNIGFEKSSIHTSYKSDNQDSSNTSLSSVMLMPPLKQGSYSHQTQKIGKLQIELKKVDPVAFQNEIFENLKDFSESWRQRAQKDDKRKNQK